MLFLNLLPILITAVGIYFLLRLRFFIFLNPKGVFAKLRCDGGKSFSSLALALAGTLGVGNIVGVAVGISVGGAGSVFWLLLSAVFAAVIKFSEAVISADRGSGYGMIGVVMKSFGGFSRLIAPIYAALIILLSFTMGSMLQSASIGQSISYTVPIPLPIVSLLLLAALFPAVLLGSAKIERITVAVIPLATVLYSLIAVLAIIMNIERLPSAVMLVLKSAFTVKGGAGGAVGSLLSLRIREGFLRGLISNEAGAGTSTLAHAKNPTSDVGSVGVMGMCEIFFDTVLLCMLTAFATLVTVPNPEGLSGMEIIASGIGGVLGDFSLYAVTLCIFFFAYSTIVCWYYYGSAALGYLIGRGNTVFTLLFVLSAALGVYVRGDGLVSASDVLLFFLSLISLAALMKNSDRIRNLSESSGLIKFKSQRRERPSLTRRKYIPRGRRERH